jgi:hypothetical protein
VRRHWDRTRVARDREFRCYGNWSSFADVTMVTPREACGKNTTVELGGVSVVVFRSIVVSHTR